MGTKLRPGLLTVVATVALSLAINPVQPAGAAVTCDRWASTAGSDANPGTQAEPVRSIKQLITILSDPEDAGVRTGCLVAGQTFLEPIGSVIVDALGGTPGDPVVIQSSGTPRASIRAQIELKPTSHDITFTDLNFVGTPGDQGASMLILDGDRITLRNNDITYTNGICVDVGNIEGGQAGEPGSPADDFVLDRNRIHDCGTSRPVDNLGQSGLHGVYVENTNDAVVTNNVIYDNMNRGLQLYPLAEGTLVEHNVFDGNSSNVNIGGYEPLDRYSDNNVVRDNIITNALLKRYFVPGWPVGGDISSVVGNFPEARPITNSVTENCLWYDDPSLRQQTYYVEGYGLDFSGNTFADPLYVDRAGKDFTLQPGSPCAGKGPQPEEPGETTCDGQVATVVGTSGADSLVGTAGVDVIVGLGGGDTISGLGGNDVICAGDGDDLVLPGAGDETSVDGGAGSDTISYADATSPLTVNLTNGEMFHPGDGDYDTFTGFENAVGSDFADTLVGSAGANRLQGGGAVDSYSAEAGNDTILARDGEGTETIACGSGTDSAIVDQIDFPNPDCENVSYGGSVAGDFDGDGDADLAIYRPSDGVWYVKGQPPFERWGGVAGDVPVAGDYDGDGDTDVAIYRPGEGIWYVKQQAVWEQWGGQSGDLPVPGDYDGDGTTDLAVYRPSEGIWYVKGQFELQLGQAGDVPVPADYNGDGITDPAVFRPASGTWLINDQPPLYGWGTTGDIPIPADYNGDGTTDPAVYRPSDGVWYIHNQPPYDRWGGITGDIPAPANYDGNDNTADINTYRPTDGIWYLKTQTTWEQWGGQPGDIVTTIPPATWLTYHP